MGSGKIKKKRQGRRRWRQRLRWSDGISNSMDMSLRRLQEMVKDEEAWHVAVQDFVTKQQIKTAFLCLLFPQ